MRLKQKQKGPIRWFKTRVITAPPPAIHPAPTDKLPVVFRTPYSGDPKGSKQAHCCNVDI